jgi:hypothetical protein
MELTSNLSKKAWEKYNDLDQHILSAEVTTMAMIECILASIESKDEDRVLNSIIGLKEFVMYQSNASSEKLTSFLNELR